MPTTMEVANRYVELCRQGENEKLLSELYSPDAVSVEAASMPNMGREAKGLAAIRGKGEWWFSNHEVHRFDVGEPWPHDDRFIVVFDIDVTNKPSGQRIQMKEAGLFTLENGRIVREEFFYPAG